MDRMDRIEIKDRDLRFQILNAFILNILSIHVNYSYRPTRAG
jgi:hypothetical protein